MDDRRPLTTLLSQVLVAFAIECDNEAERQLHEATPKRFPLASLPLWANYLRFIDEDGISVRNLAAFACVNESTIASKLAALSRWRYVEVEPDVADDRDRPPYRDWIVKSTRLGRLTRRIWSPIVALVEERYRGRFGDGAIDRLRLALESIVDRLDSGLPSFLPILDNDSYARVDVTLGAPNKPRDLATLLSDVLLAYTLAFESDSPLSYPVGANLLRVLGDEPVPLRELPSRTGITKETIVRCVAFVARTGLAIVEPNAAGPRGRSVRLTRDGENARDAFVLRDASIARDWERCYGADAIDRLREALAAVLDARDGDVPRIAAGLVPPADGWRASKSYRSQTSARLANPVAALPHYPMVTYRGGWLDGS